MILVATGRFGARGARPAAAGEAGAAAAAPPTSAPRAAGVGEGGAETYRLFLPRAGGTR